MTDPTMSIPVTPSFVLPLVKLQLLNGNVVEFYLPPDMPLLAFVGRLSQSRRTGVNEEIMFMHRNHTSVVFPMDVVFMTIEETP